MKKFFITMLVILALVLTISLWPPRYFIQSEPPGTLWPYESWFNAEAIYKKQVNYNEMTPAEQREIDWECATAQLNVLYEIADTFDPLNMDITNSDSATDWFPTLNSQFSYPDPAEYSRSFYQLAVNRFPEMRVEVQRLAARAAETIVSRAVAVAEGYVEKGDYHSAFLWYAYILSDTWMYPAWNKNADDYIPEEEQLAYQQRQDALLGWMPDVPCYFIEGQKRQYRSTGKTYKTVYTDWFFGANRYETIHAMQNALDDDGSLMEYALDAELNVDGWYAEEGVFHMDQQFSTCSFSFDDYYTLEYFGVYGRNADDEKNRELILMKAEHDEEAGIMNVEYDVRDIDELMVFSRNPGMAYAPYSQVVVLNNIVFHR